MARVDARSPLQKQLAQDLRTKIRSGELPLGGRLPSEAELSQQYGVSRTTTRLALDQLVNEGLVMRAQGRGSFVRQDEPLLWHASRFEGPSRHDDAAAGLDAWAADVATQGRTPRQDVEVALVQPPPFVADRLQLDSETARCVVRRRVRYVDDEPALIADSFFPESLAEGTVLMDPGDIAAPGGLLAALGHVQAKFVDEIAIRMPTEEEAGRLSMPAGTPIAEHMRTGYANDGTPLRVMISLLPGDRHRIVYEIDAGGT